MTITVRLEAQLTPGIWTDLTDDVIAADTIRIAYGIDGSGPTANVASSGEVSFALRNDAGNSGGLLGYYSPTHANVRAGWTFGIPVRVVMGSTAASVTSITRAGVTATVTTAAPHGLATGAIVTISGADQSAYNGAFTITQTGASTFTYTVTGVSGGSGGFPLLFGNIFSSPASPATGTIITWAQSYVKFYGRVQTIVPEAGQYRSRRVHVVAQDAMGDLMEAPVRELAVAIDSEDDVLYAAVLDALPAAAQPLARALDPGVDQFPYAFDNIEGGRQAGTLIKQIADSSYGWAFVRGDGTFTTKNRHSRATATSAATFTDTMMDVTGPSSLDVVFNIVRTTIHPRTIDQNVRVLYASPNVPIISPGESVEIWGDYHDPDNAARLIGGVAVETSLIAGVDYLGNSAQDGTGVDLTGNLSVSVTAFASTAKFTVTNIGTSVCYVTTLQVRGQGVYDDGPQSFEARTTQTYGERVVDLDMTYQDNSFIGQSAADFIERQFRDLSQSVESVTFAANASQALLTQVLTRDIGDKITLSETATGLTSVAAFIRRVELEIVPGPIVTCTWGLTTAGSASAQWWQLGTAGRSELGLTASLGF